MKVPKKEAVWGIKAAVVDLAGDQERCIKQFAENARKSVKCLSSPAKTARFIARSAFRSAKIAVVKRRFLPKYPLSVRGYFVFFNIQGTF